MQYKQFLGVLLGGIYGLGIRFLFETDTNMAFNKIIYSISFVWILPFVMALIPILFAKEAVSKSYLKSFFYPIFSVFIFFAAAISTGIEDWLCILLLTIPFTLTAGISGLILAYWIKNHSSTHIYSLLFLPIISQPIEAQLPNLKQSYYVESSIVIENTPSAIWDNIIEVPAISMDEYNYSFLNYMGVPRPIRSTLKSINGVTYRIGEFSDGLRLYETIEETRHQQYVAFKIHLEQSQLRNTSSDKHILQSDLFHFNKIAYTIHPINEHQSELQLSCSYTIASKMNAYSNFWASLVIEDFETKLLAVLKQKIEHAD